MIPEYIEQALRNLRPSKLREKTILLFIEQKKPLSVPELVELLSKQNITAHKTSIYRQIEVMLQAKILTEVQLFPGTTHYEIIADHHHHYFVCGSCKNTNEIEDEALEKAIHILEENLKKQGNTPKHHAFQIQGICKECIE